MSRITPRSALDRTPRNIPLPLHGMSAVRTPRDVGRRALRRVVRRVMLVVSLLAVVAAAVIAVLPVVVEAGMVDGRVVIGDMVLTRTPGGSADIALYTGGVALAVVRSGGAPVRAAAAWTAGGWHHWGRCDLERSAPRIVERCTFDGAPGPVTAVDTLAHGGRVWHRVYSDGTTVDIAVPSRDGLIPVPLPIGR